MTDVMRGPVSAVDTAGVYVRVAALGPDVVGPLPWLGSLPAVDDGVLVLNAGTESAPDLVVVALEVAALAGATFTGPVTVSAASAYFQLSATSGSSSLIVRAAAGSGAWIRLRSGTSDRWWIGRSAAAESGANAGSNLEITRCADDGTQVSTPAVRIDRSSGLVTFGRATATTDGATSAVTKGYVDAIKSALAASSSFTDFQTRVAAL